MTDPTPPGGQPPAVPPPSSWSNAEQPPAEQPPAGPPPGPQPASPWTATPPAPPDGPAFQAPPPSPKRRTWPRAVLAAVLVVLVAAIVRGVVAVATRADPLDAAAYELVQTLPSESRDRIKEELKATVASSTQGLSSEQARARISDLTVKGFARLDDQRAIRRLELQVAALNAADPATCAAFGRASIAGTLSGERDLAIRLIRALKPAELEEWFELSIAAIKLEQAGQPAAQRVTDADFERVMTPVFEAYSEAEATALQNVSSNPKSVTDAEVCSVIRRLYTAAVQLPPNDRVIVARYDIQP